MEIIGGYDTLAYKEMIEEAILNRKQVHMHYNSKDRIIEPAHMLPIKRATISSPIVPIEMNGVSSK